MGRKSQEFQDGEGDKRMNHKHPYEPNPSQVEFHKSNKRYKGFMGSKGSGKTRTGIEEGWTLSYEFPGNVGVVARKDYPALERTTMQYFLDWCPKELIVHFNKVTRKLVIRSKDPKKPSTVYFVQEKEPKEFESLELGWFFIDEADECPYQTWQIMQSRLRLKNVPNYGMVAFNPTNRLHWLYDFFISQPKQDPQISDRQLFNNNTYENLHNLPSDYCENLERIYTGDDLKRYLHGEWGSTSNEWQVFNNWRSSTNIAKDYVKSIVGPAYNQGMGFWYESWNVGGAVVWKAV